MRGVRWYPSRVAVGGALCMWLAVVGQAAAQPCPISLPTDDQRLGYRQRTNVLRCEGTYVSPVSGQASFALVSLTQGRVIYRLNQDRELLIRLPAGNAETRILAVGLPLQRYYRMDAALSPGRPEFRLPLADVINPAGISAEELGVFGLRDISPTRVGHVPLVATTSGAPADQGLIAIIRPGADVLDVRWRLVPQNGAATGWQPVPGGTGLVPEGARLQLTLPPSLPAARTELEITFFAQGVPDTNRFTLLAP